MDIGAWHGWPSLVNCEASVPSDMYMEHMGAACEDAVKALVMFHNW